MTTDTIPPKAPCEAELHEYEVTIREITNVCRVRRFKAKNPEEAQYMAESEDWRDWEPIIGDEGEAYIENIEEVRP